MLYCWHWLTQISIHAFQLSLCRLRNNRFVSQVSKPRIIINFKQKTSRTLPAARAKKKKEILFSLKSFNFILDLTEELAKFFPFFLQNWLFGQIYSGILAWRFRTVGIFCQKQKNCQKQERISIPAIDYANVMVCKEIN